MPSELFIQQLKQYSDIEQIVSSYVPLKKKGRYLTGLCPFHSEKTPSFFVYPQTQSFYCFGCGAGGDVITFIRRIENLDYMEAVRFLAQRAGLQVPEDRVDDGMAKLRARILEINREAARFYHSVLMSEQGAARSEERPRVDASDHPSLWAGVFAAVPLCLGGFSGQERLSRGRDDPGECSV